MNDTKCHACTSRQLILQQNMLSALKHTFVAKKYTKTWYNDLKVAGLSEQLCAKDPFTTTEHANIVKSLKSEENYQIFNNSNNNENIN